VAALGILVASCVLDTSGLTGRAPGLQGDAAGDAPGESGAANGDGSAGPGGSGLDFTPGRKCVGAALANATYVMAGAALSGAVDALANGGTLVIGPGTYTGPVIIHGKTNVTVCAAVGARPVVNGTSDACLIDIDNSTGVHVEGLELAGTNDPSHSHQCGVHAGAMTDHVAIWDMWIHDTPSAGVGAANGSGGHIDVRYSRIWNTSAYDTFHQSAISFYELDNYGGPNDASGYSDYVVGNLIFANVERISGAANGNCIFIDDNQVTEGNRTGQPYTGRVLIVNNLCVNNGGRGVHFLTSRHGDVVNNTFFHDARTNLGAPVGEIDAPGGEDIGILNNLSVAVSPGSVFDNTGLGSTVALSHNIFSGPGSRNPPSGFVVVADPMLVNPADPPNGDFRPRPGSPVVGAGAAALNGAAAPAVDLSGKARPPGAPSVGAFEP
jgi:hypothetical protein